MDYKFDYSLQEIAQQLNGRVIGNKQHRVSCVKPLNKASSIALSFLINDSYKPELQTTKAGAILIAEIDLTCIEGNNAIVVADPRLALTNFIQYLIKSKQNWQPFIHPGAIIGNNCTISSNVIISAGCIIGNNVKIADYAVLGPGTIIANNVSIGNNTELKARVTIDSDVKIGNNCIFYSGVVLGSDGFGYAKTDNRWVKTPQIGGVTIGDNVEIGANTAVDRGFIEDTVIEDGVIIDNLVQIAHNVHIGTLTAIAGCVGIAGSTKIGARCLIGGGAAIAGHIVITDDVIITATSAVNRSLLAPGQYSSGLPAKPSARWRKNVARFNLLDSMAKRLYQVEKKLYND